jgi:dipeptidyl aminopeptidase/acylaminoacyl peptidase
MKVMVPLVFMIAVSLMSYSSRASEPLRVTPPAREANPAPVSNRPGKILIWVDEKPHLISPEGNDLDSPRPIPKLRYSVELGTAKLSPDGTRVAFEVRGENVTVAAMPARVPGGIGFKAPSQSRTNLRILDLGGRKDSMQLESIYLNSFHWFGDGKKMYLSGYEIREGPFVDLAFENLEYWEYDPASNKRVPLKVPANFTIRAVSPNGKTMLVDEWKGDPTQWYQRAHLWTVGTEKPVPLLEVNQSVWEPIPKFSPDGKQLLCRVEHYGKYKLAPQGGGGFMFEDFRFNHVVVIDLATKQQMVVKEFEENPEWRVRGLAWSPNGRKIAYVETEGDLRLSSRTFRVTVADPDGKHAKVIRTLEGKQFVGFDWR